MPGFCGFDRSRKALASLGVDVAIRIPTTVIGRSILSSEVQFSSIELRHLLSLPLFSFTFVHLLAAVLLRAPWLRL